MKIDIPFINKRKKKEIKKKVIMFNNISIVNDELNNQKIKIDKKI